MDDIFGKRDLILSLDVASREKALPLLKALKPNVDWVKIGLQLFIKEGRSFLDEVAASGYHIFLDLKLHDIPNTVASAIKSLEGCPIKMLTIHTCGGLEMMQRAREAQQEAIPEAILLGVTVLTSMNQEALASLGYDSTPVERVKLLARLAQTAGVQGLVCSAHELTPLREELGKDIVLVTPGIRPQGAATDDQKRVMTPADAAAAGTSFIVVGRPILKAEDPLSAAQNIRTELNSGTF